MKKRYALFALALAAGCDKGETSKPGLELKKETIRRLDAGEQNRYEASSPAPEPVSSPAPTPPTNQAPVAPIDAGPIDAGGKPHLTNQAPHAR